jgi:Family of unknown function (DUF5317)
MILLLAAVALSLALGYLLGGRLRGFEHVRLRWWGLAPVGLVLQVPPPVHGEAREGVALGMLIASYVVLMVFAARNLRVAGFPLLLIGLFLNFLVVSVNSGMPVSRHAVVASGQGDLLKELEAGTAVKHHLSGPDDVLLPLGDVVPIGTPINQVVSAGDLFVYTGLVVFVVMAMRNGRGNRRPAREADDPSQTESLSKRVEPS